MINDFGAGVPDVIGAAVHVVGDIVFLAVRETRASLSGYARPCATRICIRARRARASPVARRRQEQVHSAARVRREMNEIVRRYDTPMLERLSAPVSGRARAQLCIA